MALEVLAGGAALGLICGVLVKGFAGQTILSQFTQYLTAILLTLTIMVFVMLVLGAIIYIPASLIRLWRRRCLQRERSAESQAPVAMAS
jgi:Na+-transporting methylmalonyl-CoA/oxaloacetate decarboxylase gamma subunit